MKKGIFCLVSWLLLLSGCHFGEKEVKEARYHVSAEEEIFYKKPILWQIMFHNEQYGIQELVTLNHFGYKPPSERLTDEQIAFLVKVMAERINRPMRNPSFNENGQIIPGETGYLLTESLLKEQLKNANWQVREMKLPMEKKEPTVTVEQLQNIMNHMIGTYTTYFNPKVTGRATNIALSSKAINYYVLGPGDIFSFNEVVGERTKERGYQEAYEIVNDEFVIGIGGGVCQTSSTLFNAIDAAGLGVIERHAHTKSIGYVPANRDATVAWGSLDFKFVNDYDHPVLIKTNVSLEKGILTVSVYAEKTKELLAKR